MEPSESSGLERTVAVRRLIGATVAALVLSACGGATETVENAPASNDVSARPSNDGSDFCRSVEELESFDEEDPALEAYDLYSFLEEVHRRLADTAPAELEADFTLIISALERYGEWAADPLQPDPLDEADQREFEAANSRIATYIQEECGLSFDDEDPISESAVETQGAGSDDDSTSRATLTISVGGDTHEEILGGAYEVSCDLYGDTESGSIGVYLESSEFQSSVSSYDSGVEPGTYAGQIWVFASDSVLDELLWDLQEIDGTFVLDQAEQVSDEEWLLAGTFSAAVEDPPASIDATFTCVGLVG